MMITNSQKMMFAIVNKSVVTYVAKYMISYINMSWKGRIKNWAILRQSF